MITRKPLAIVNGMICISYFIDKIINTAFLGIFSSLTIKQVLLFETQFEFLFSG